MGISPLRLSPTRVMAAAFLPPMRSTLVAPGLFEPSVRGSGMLDIIFKGARRKAPAEYAEVILQLESTEPLEEESGGRQRVRRRKIPKYRRQIGMVFQDHKLLYDRPVYDNVALPLIIAGVGHRDAGRRVRAALDQVGLLHKERRSPETLSAGEQQRVGIARAIVTRPKLLIADEPTGNLDPDLSLEVMRIFRRFNEVGVTLLVASHDIALIDKLGCRRIELEDGRLQDPAQEEDDEWL